MKNFMISLVIPVLLVPAVISAENITKNDAKRAAIAWLHSAPRFVSAQSTYTAKAEVITLTNPGDNQILAYVAELEPRGFIIIAPARDLNPIIAYSTVSDFDSTDHPDNTLLTLLRGDMSEKLNALKAGVLPPRYRNKNSSHWDISLQMVNEQEQVLYKPAPVMYDVDHGPFLSSQWGQGADYYGNGNPAFNYYTPENYVCGCVATAMGQILNYYEWPQTGTDDHSYTWDNEVDDPRTLSADFSATAYDWSNILDVYRDAYTSETERSAVGRLTYDCGVAVDMNYAEDGSGSFVSDVAFAARTYFRHAATWVPNADNFYTRLYDNMVNHRPAEISIQGYRLSDAKPAGHAIVADGVHHFTGETKYYHLNMGWSGSSDAWYTLETPPFDAGGYRWTTVTGAVLDIVPTPVLGDIDEETTSPNFSLSWDVPALLDAASYELQAARISASSGDFSDDAESGTGSWLIHSNWEQSAQRRYSGSYAFRGYIDTSTIASTMLLNKALYIEPSTAISYMWERYYLENADVRLELSIDGVNWETLASYIFDDQAPYSTAWTQENGIDLSSYVGQTAALRFSIRHTGGNFYPGVKYPDVGFFVDNLSITAFKTGEWSTVEAALGSTTGNVTVSENGTYAYRVRANWNATAWEWSNMESVEVNAALAELKVFLEGPYDAAGDTMFTALADNNDIPLTAPYSEDARTVATIPHNVTDWVLVQLRTTIDGAAVASRSAFLRNDGRVVNEDGDTQLMMDTAEGYYYPVVRHRNHLAVMSPDSIALTASGSALYDFTTGTAQYRGADAVLLKTGVYGLYSGDASGNQQVQNDDKNDYWKIQVGTAGYRAADFNLNGQVQNNDKNDFWKANVGKGTRVSGL